MIRTSIGLAAIAFSLGACSTPLPGTVTGSDSEERSGAISLADMGTFYVGGREVATATPASAGPPFAMPPASGSTIVDQSFVEYHVPARRKTGAAPIVFVPGGSLLGSQYQSKPDGRPGWNTRFLQAGYPTYLLEPANRGRSGFRIDDLNRKLLGASEPLGKNTGLWHFIGEVGWPQFGVGTVARGQVEPFRPSVYTPHPNGRFAAKDSAQLFAAFVPNRFDNPKAEVEGLVALLARTGPAIVLAHSLGGLQAFQATAQVPDKVKAIVAIEPVGCPGESASPPFTAATAKGLVDARIPVLVLYGDFITGGTLPQGYRPFQEERRKVCRSLASQLSSAGIKADVISLPEDRAIRGNSHLMMMEDNSDEIAALIDGWLTRLR